jgi:hypothetical protein
VAGKPANFRDVTGQRFGRLVVVERHGSWRGQAAWLCRCDCGNDIVVPGVSLRSGNTQSCRCLQRERSRESHTLPQGVAAFNKAVFTMKANAARRALRWDITDEALRTLLSQDCHYCGGPPSNVSASVGGVFTYNGLDRVDNELGYCLENVVPCCIACNTAKSDMHIDEFESWVIRLAARILNRKASQ